MRFDEGRRVRATTHGAENGKDGNLQYVTPLSYCCVGCNKRGADRAGVLVGNPAPPPPSYETPLGPALGRLEKKRPAILLGVLNTPTPQNTRLPYIRRGANHSSIRAYAAALDAIDTAARQPLSRRNIVSVGNCRGLPLTGQDFSY